MKGGEDQSGSGERSVLQGDGGREEHMNLFGQTVSTNWVSLCVWCVCDPPRH